LPARPVQSAAGAAPTRSRRSRRSGRGSTTADPSSCRNQVAELHIGLAEQFARHPRHRVPGEKEAGKNAREAPRPPTLGDKQHDKQQEAFANGLVQLAWMARHRPAVRKYHGPRDAGWPAEQLAIDEVRDAPEKQSDWDRR